MISTSGLYSVRKWTLLSWSFNTRPATGLLKIRTLATSSHAAVILTKSSRDQQTWSMYHILVRKAADCTHITWSTGHHNKKMIIFCGYLENYASLLYLWYWPSSPTLPQTAFTIRMLHLHYQLWKTLSCSTVILLDIQWWRCWSMNPSTSWIGHGIRAKLGRASFDIELGTWYIKSSCWHWSL